MACLPIFKFADLKTSPRDFAPLGIASLDTAMDGMPRGAITELSGNRSSGKTTLALSALAASTRRGEYCAYIDTTNSLDVVSASKAGIELSRLIWLRCDHDLPNACKAADVLLHAGGFGMVCLDIADARARELNQIPASYWFRYRKAVENSSTSFVVLSGQPMTGAASARAMECKQSEAAWRGHLLKSIRLQAIQRKPPRSPITFFAKTG